MEFDEKVQREYQTVILAALLQNVGELLNIGVGPADFLNHHQFTVLTKAAWIDQKLLKTLCLFHHKAPVPIDVDQSHTAILSSIIKQACACVLKNTPQNLQRMGDNRIPRLLSIFSRVNIGKGNPPKRYYGFSPLTSLDFFPRHENAFDNDRKNLDYLIDQFKASITYLKPASFEHLFHGILSLMEVFLWCIPSQRDQEDSDISLFDYLSMVSGIASCLYHYHHPEFNEASIGDDQTKKFRLVGGDLSGIQKHIFEIHENNPRRLSKTLRGRSFGLSLFTEAVSMRYLRALNLPITCRVINAGGRFVLLIPSTKDAKEIFEKIKGEVDDWFYRNFLGRITLQVDDSIGLSMVDLKPPLFPEKLRELSKRLEELKHNRLVKHIFSNDFSMLKEVGKQLGDKRKGPCSFCGIFPAIGSSADDPGEKLCLWCIQSQKLGEKLVSSGYISLGKPSKSSVDVVGVGIDLLNEIQNPSNYFLIEKITNGEEQTNPGYVQRFIANYIPKPGIGLICDHDHRSEQIHDCSSLCSFCQSPCDVEERDAIRHGNLSFQCIATTTIKRNGYGVDHLAVIKGDVDYLGLIISHGLKEHLSITRIAALSRMLNMFFMGYIPGEVKRKGEHVYVVYAGGDDFALIGPWEEGIEFAIRIEEKFKEFVGMNPNITLSQGISLMRPRSPVPWAVQFADRNLEASKEAGRDRLTLFDTIMEWKDIEPLTEFKDFLNGEIEDNASRMKRSFLYRLLAYQKLFLQSEDGKIEGLKFHSLMNYDVRRNIEQKNKKGEVINSETIERLGRLYKVIGHIDKQLMKNLKIPIFWTLYRNRRRIRGKEV
jgi:CRISPR-associated protein Csm1